MLEMNKKNVKKVKIVEKMKIVDSDENIVES